MSTLVTRLPFADLTQHETAILFRRKFFKSDTYDHLFIDGPLHGDILADCDDNDLIHFGFAAGVHRRKILKIVQELKESGVDPADIEPEVEPPKPKNFWQLLWPDIRALAKSPKKKTPETPETMMSPAKPDPKARTEPPSTASTPIPTYGQVTNGGGECPAWRLPRS